MESIWEEWATHYEALGIDPSRICKDGIVDPVNFYEQSVKILFIGKEVNDWKGGDMRSLARNGPRHIYLHNLARWAVGLLNDFPEFKLIDNKKSLNSALKMVSLINLKKTSGGSSANMTAISAYANNDKALLLRQIDLISPNVIIPLGTHDISIWLLNLEANPDHPNRAPYYSANAKAWVIPWKHPSIRGDSEKVYNDFSAFINKSPDLRQFHSPART